VASIADRDRRGKIEAIDRTAVTVRIGAIAEIGGTGAIARRVRR